MEQAPSTALFSLSIDPITKAHLSETARWARFLALVGLIFLALMVLMGVFGSAMMFSTSLAETQYGGLGAGLFAGYMIVVVAIWFFPLFFTMKFATQMRRALAGNDQQALNTSFQNLKICFRFMGILTIIGLSFMVIAIVLGIIGAAAFS
jgi:hypothetical protein